MSRSLARAVLLPLALLLAALLSPHPAKAAASTADTQKTIADYKRTDPGLAPFFRDAAGYVVFPSVGKGAFIVGGAHGDGILYEKGRALGTASLTQVTVGAQAGGQTYSEIIFFQTPAALDQFKHNEYAFSAQMSAVALKSGVSADAKYRDGVLVITAGEGGLMFEASVGGQKFHFEPYSRS